MGKLVRFDKSDRLISAQSSAKGEGQIVLFTGVRYERNTDPDLAKKRKSPTKRKRRRR